MWPFLCLVYTRLECSNYIVSYGYTSIQGAPEYEAQSQWIHAEETLTTIICINIWTI